MRLLINESQCAAWHAPRSSIEGFGNVRKKDKKELKNVEQRIHWNFFTEGLKPKSYVEIERIHIPRFSILVSSLAQSCRVLDLYLEPWSEIIKV